MSESESSKSNIPEFSVSELAFSLKKTLEENYERVRVRGELSRVSIASSGHMYSSLKDENAVIDAVCWKGVLSKLNIRPEEGLEVICIGRISTYPQRSNYQLIIESIELAGEGALLKMLEERKKKLAAEGLFDLERKKNIPFLPQTIGVVTSPTGAVIRDILHRLQDRFPRHVLVWPVLVQGESAAEQIAAAINGFQTLHNHNQPKPDLLIIARGGGSLEDLMPFNEEIVIRAVANSIIPIISAIGHETDTTLIDYAADLRAPTPTGAAEMAVPMRSNLIAQILDDETRLLSGMNRMLLETKYKLEAQSGKLIDPLKLLEIHVQKLDHLGDKITGVFKHYISRKQKNIIEVGARLHTPRDQLLDAQKTLARWAEQLSNLTIKITKDRKKELFHIGDMLEAYSFENILKRGFTVIQSSDNTLITEAGQAISGSHIKIRFKHNQYVNAVFGKKASSLNLKKPKKIKIKKNKTDDNQISLF